MVTMINGVNFWKKSSEFCRLEIVNLSSVCVSCVCFTADTTLGGAIRRKNWTNIFEIKVNPFMYHKVKLVRLNPSRCSSLERFSAPLSPCKDLFLKKSLRWFIFNWGFREWRFQKKTHISRHPEETEESRFRHDLIQENNMASANLRYLVFPTVHPWWFTNVRKKCLPLRPMYRSERWHFLYYIIKIILFENMRTFKGSRIIQVGKDIFAKVEKLKGGGGVDGKSLPKDGKINFLKKRCSTL